MKTMVIVCSDVEYIFMLNMWFILSLRDKSSDEEKPETTLQQILQGPLQHLQKPHALNLSILHPESVIVIVGF